MKKSTKGAVAAAAAGALLLGGAGSLAYWTADADVTGGNISSGNLSLSTPDCGVAAAAWTLDSVEPGTAFNPATDKLVPGDVISKVCDTVVTAKGNHLRATVSAEPGLDSDELFVATAPATTPLMTVGVGSVEVNTAAAPTTFVGVPATGITEAADGQKLRVKVTVTFSEDAEDLSTQGVTSALDDISLTATQVHN